MRVTETKIAIDDTYMNVIRFGEGIRPLVLISGLCLCGLEGSGGAVAGAYSCFCKDFEVFLVERRKDVPEGFSTFDMAEDVFRVMQELSVESADVIGYSQGGMISLALAAEHPGFVRRLIIGSTAARTDERNIGVFGKWLTLAALDDSTALNRQLNKNVYSPEYLEKYADAFRTLENSGDTEDKKRFSILCRAIINTDLTDRLKDITAETFVIGSGMDRVFGAAPAEELAAALGSKCYIYPNASHAAYDEEPDYKQRMLEFLR